MTDNKTAPIQIIIPPAVLADMEQNMSPEDVQLFLDELKVAVESGSFLEDSVPLDLDTVQIDDPELYAQICASMSAQGFDDFDSWADNQITPPTLLN
jgi:hypothetical protein